MIPKIVIAKPLLISYQFNVFPYYLKYVIITVSYTYDQLNICTMKFSKNFKSKITS